jgi:hypothetical protein
LQGKANIEVKLDPVLKGEADVGQQNNRVTVRSVHTLVCVVSITIPTLFCEEIGKLVFSNFNVIPSLTFLVQK